MVLWFIGKHVILHTQQSLENIDTIVIFVKAATLFVSFFEALSMLFIF